MRCSFSRVACRCRPFVPEKKKCKSWMGFYNTRNNTREDISKFPSIEEVVFKHRLQRDRIREFMIYYFFPYYTFDLNESLIFFIAGRNEFHDKGIDIYIKALGNLNEI